MTGLRDGSDGRACGRAGVPERAAPAIRRRAALTSLTSVPDGGCPAVVTAMAVTVSSSRSSAAIAGCQAMARCRIHCGSAMARWNSVCRVASWMRARACGAVPRVPSPTAWSRIAGDRAERVGEVRGASCQAQLDGHGA